MKTLFIFTLSGLCLSFIGNEPSALSGKRMNVLYLGLDNPITIAHPKYSCDRLVVRLEPESLARLEPVACGRYQIKLKKRNRHGLKVLVYKDNVKDKNLLSSQNFRTLKIASPVVSLNGAVGPHISREALLKVTEVQVRIPGIVYDGINYRVSSYDYIFKQKGGVLIRGTSSSQQLPVELIEAISEVKEDDLLIITNVYADAPGLGKVPLAGSLVFTAQE